MSDQPALLKVLEYLREIDGAQTTSDIISGVHESENYITVALDTLRKQEIISHQGGTYHYNPTPRTEQFFSHLVEVYHQVARRPEQELILRGLLSQLPVHYLLRTESIVEVLGKEGMDTEEVRKLVQKGVDAGNVKRVKVLFAGPRYFNCPVYIPPYYATNLESISAQEFDAAKADYQANTTPFSEEEYLMGCYPPELAEPAREHLRKEKRDIVDYLRGQYHSDWFWFRLRRG